MVKGVCRDYLSCWNKANLRSEAPVELPRPANDNPPYELGKVYDSIRVQYQLFFSFPAVLYKPVLLHNIRQDTFDAFKQVSAVRPEVLALTTKL